jgi:hypothetical protein
MYFDFPTAQNGKLCCVARYALKNESYVSQEETCEYCDFPLFVTFLQQGTLVTNITLSLSLGAFF